LACLDNGLLRGFEQLAARTVIALRFVEDLLMACLGGNATFYPPV
jgi:hypothetical protein